MRPAIALHCILVKTSVLSRRARLAATCLGLAALCHTPAHADSINAAYHGRDLGLNLHDAIAQVQATGGSQGAHLKLSVSGTGDQLMFTEVSSDTIETETASYKDLEFADVDVRKVGELEGRYGITLRATSGSVNDHIVAIAAGKSAEPVRDSALGYMDFWLVDPDMKRVRHLADLLATVGARLGEQLAPNTAAPVLAAAAAIPVHAIAEHLEDAADVVEDMPVVQPAPRIPVIAAAPDDDESVRDAAQPSGKCLFPAPKKPKHAKAHYTVPGWSTLKQGMMSGSGRLLYRIAALHSEDDHQTIQFYLGNSLPVPATVVARVILTSSDGTQQAEDIGLNQLGGRATKTDESLNLKPFDSNTCITDVDVTEVHACPLPDDAAERDDSADIFRCNADAAAGTTTVKGITYVSGREPKSLALPTDAIVTAKAGN